MMVEMLEMAIGDITPYENNPRKNDVAVDRVAKSISEFGFNSPIVVDENHVIINGHTRYKAALKLELPTVPVVVARGLTPSQIKAYRIMDNRSSEIAEWDNDLLLKEILDIIQDGEDGLPIEVTGFTADELSKELGIQLNPKEKKKKGDKVEGTEEFATELLESHNYVVLYFDNELDWQVAKEKFHLTTVNWQKGVRGENFASRGIGRVIRGADVLSRLKEE